MHVITWPEIDDLARQVLGKTCQPGVEYLAEDDVAGSYMHAYSAHIRVKPWEGKTKLDPDVDYNGKRVLVMRAGGLGDVLFLTPAIHAFKAKFPKAEVFFSTMGQCPLLLLNNQDLEGFLPYPCPVEKLPEFVVSVEHMIEFSQPGRTTHVIDLFASAFGLELSSRQKGMVLKLSEEEEGGARQYLPPVKDGKFRFGIQVVANLPVRTYPYMIRVAESLIKRGHQVVAFGAPGQPIIPHSINVHAQAPPLNIRQSASLVTQCDCIIAPDSVLTHIAGALDVPCVAIYGSFPASLRTQYAKKTLAIQAEGTCAPCFHHGRMTVFPMGCPTAHEGYCGVLASIKVEQVRDQALRWAFEWQKVEA